MRRLRAGSDAMHRSSHSRSFLSHYRTTGYGVLRKLFRRLWTGGPTASVVCGGQSRGHSGGRGGGQSGRRCPRPGAGTRSAAPAGDAEVRHRHRGPVGGPAGRSDRPGPSGGGWRLDHPVRRRWGIAGADRGFTVRVPPADLSAGSDGAATPGREVCVVSDHRDARVSAEPIPSGMTTAPQGRPGNLLIHMSLHVPWC